jgi:peptidoglycan/xylan/chitin deacetylase (PgdA/CDA1 family)
MKRHFTTLERIITRLYSITILHRNIADRFFVPILAYHGICDLPHEISRIYSYDVSTSIFKDQMEFLKKNNYSVIGLTEIIQALKKKKFPPKAVVITFDDGYKNNYTNAFQILRQYNFPATIFLATDYIGTNQIFPWLESLSGNNQKIKENWLHLSWNEIAKMNQNNVAFGSHTCTHSNIRLIDKNTLIDEIKRSKSTIEDNINKKIGLFSYPFSFPKYRKAYQSIIRESRYTLQKNGFSGACTTIIGTNSLGSDPFCLKRIQITNTDNIFHFKAKIEGDYNWAGFAQKIYQKIFEPLLEIKSNK